MCRQHKCRVNQRFLAIRKEFLMFCKKYMILVSGMFGWYGGEYIDRVGSILIVLVVY